MISDNGFTRKIQKRRAFLQGRILEKYLTEQNAQYFAVFCRKKQLFFGESPLRKKLRCDKKSHPKLLS